MAVRGEERRGQRRCKVRIIRSRWRSVGALFFVLVELELKLLVVPRRTFAGRNSSSLRGLGISLCLGVVQRIKVGAKLRALLR